MPAYPMKAGEVTVIGVDDRAILDGDGGDGGVGQLGATDTDRSAELLVDPPVTVTWIKDANVWKGEPRVDSCCRLFEGDCRTWMCLDAHEGLDGEDGETDRLRA